MSDCDSGEEQYENETFENDSEVDIPEISETESEAEDENLNSNNSKNSALYQYTRNVFKSRSSRLRMKDYMQYESSTDDDTDVIITKTIAEINAEPLAIEEITTPQTLRAKSAERKSKSTHLGTYQKIYSKSYSNEQNTECYTKTESKESYTEYTETNAKIEIYDLGEASGSDKEESELEFMMAKTHIEDKIMETATQQISSDEKTQIQESDILYTSKIITPLLDTDCLSEVPDDLQSERSAMNSCPQNNHERHLVDPQSEMKLGRYELDGEFQFGKTKPSGKTQINYFIGSETPSSFNSDDFPLHFNISKGCVSREPIKPKMSNRRNMSFPNERLREIERHNHILLNKIRSQKSSLGPPKTTSHSKSTQQIPNRISSAAINRRKQQRQIDLDNQVLKRKLEAISLRRPNTHT